MPNTVQLNHLISVPSEYLIESFVLGHEEGQTYL